MQWFTTDPATLAKIILSIIGMFVAVIFVIRLNGLRTLSKMSSFDFAVTIAIGSLVATTVVSETPSLVEGIVALGALVLCQRIISQLRRQGLLFGIVDNTPILLMSGEQYQRDAMEKTRVTENDIAGKLREANVTQMNQVLAVVLESTGDISVLHSSSDEGLDRQVMKGVRER